MVKSTSPVLGGVGFVDHLIGIILPGIYGIDSDMVCRKFQTHEWELVCHMILLFITKMMSL